LTYTGFKKKKERRLLSNFCSQGGREEGGRRNAVSHFKIFLGL